MSNISSQYTGSPDALNRAPNPESPQTSPKGVAHGSAGKGSALDQPVDDGTDARLKALREQSAAQDISASQAAKAAYTVGAGQTSSSSLPTLPSNSAGSTPAATAAARSALQNLPDTGAFNSIMAFRILMESSSKNFDSQARAHSSAMQGSLNKQMAIAQDTEDKAKADQKAAVFSFMTNIAGAGAAFGLGAYGAGGKTAKAPKADAGTTNESTSSHGGSGAKIQAGQKDLEIPPSPTAGRSREERRQAEKRDFQASEPKAVDDDVLKRNKHRESTQKKDLEKREEAEEMGANQSSSSQRQMSEGGRRAGTYAASNSVSQLITSGGEAVNQNLLYGADSHHAEVQQKLDELGKSIADQMLEGSKTNKEKSAKMIDDAISALKQHFDLVKSTNDRIGG